MPNKTKILLIEDEVRWQRRYVKELEEQVETLVAASVTEAEQRMKEHPDIFLIVMDACLRNSSVDATMALTRRIRSDGFKGPLIAASSSQIFRAYLMSAGCTIDSQGKDNVSDIILENLPASQAA